MTKEIIMPTPHNEAKEGDIAKTVLMPGDPLRAKFIAETFLENSTCFNQVRNMFGFTGTYKGKQISVMASGMGQPSIGIYSYELYKFYGVENIIRIGSAGSYKEDLNIFDVFVADDAYSESTFAKTLDGSKESILQPSKKLNDAIKETAVKLGMEIHSGRVHSSDIFYHEESSDYKRGIEANNCDCVEMESFALFANARVLGKNAACILTISDSLVKHEETTAEQRQTSFTQMMKLALETALSL
ncbi:purine-nucleoside phosphorylase [Treponema sp.]|uniref:purine-nucleoside phosphorylase n=1 Tax=Treponema sp. TaxID=166 RepID=UPI00298EC5DC|nr:purine-nucleoside phosphorylase [Treponema sp.]